jgi:diaminopimelate epimerase
VKIEFYKYQGAGNDFVIVDNRKDFFPKENVELIKKICDRRFGVGADGLMLLENVKGFDFRMVYFNADGFPGSMCGNGGRCLVSFAHSLELFDRETSFQANGERYRARMTNGQVSLQMLDVDELKPSEGHVFLDTGSPHHVQFEKNVKELDVFARGRKIRFGDPYLEAGTNVNFVEQVDENTFKVRTYERGVENETLSCGTGVTAVALASYYLGKTRSNKLKIQTEGGDLQVDFTAENGKFSNVILTGPATFVYKGNIEIK